MKAIFLAFVLVISCVLIISAQSKSKVLIDNESGKFMPGKPFIGSMSDSLIKEKLQTRFPDKKLYFQDPKDKELKMDNPPKGNYMAQRGMPIYKSRKSFPMPVYQPDSTIHFFMQIKEYKKLPSNNFR